MPTRNCKLFARLILPALTFVAQNAVTAAPPEIIERRGAIVVFQAPITAATRGRLFAIFNDEVRIIVVNSGGGDPLAAIDIGREIRRRNLKLGVDGVCASACAHFLFVAAKEREVAPGSLVVFHNTGSSILKMVGATAIPAASHDRLASIAKAEKAFYGELGLSDTLLLEPQAEILTVCFRTKDPPAGDDSDVEFAQRFNGWTPTKEYLAAIGVNVAGFWPALNTIEAAEAAHRKLFTPGFKWRVFGPDKPAPREALEAAYKQFGHICSAEDMKSLETRTSR